MLESARIHGKSRDGRGDGSGDEPEPVSVTSKRARSSATSYAISVKIPKQFRIKDLETFGTIPSAVGHECGWAVLDSKTSIRPTLFMFWNLTHAHDHPIFCPCSGLHTFAYDAHVPSSHLFMFWYI